MIYRTLCSRRAYAMPYGHMRTSTCRNSGRTANKFALIYAYAIQLYVIRRMRLRLQLYSYIR